MTEKEVDTSQPSQMDEIEARWDWITNSIDNDEERLNTQQVLEKSYQEMIEKRSSFWRSF